MKKTESSLLQDFSNTLKEIAYIPLLEWVGRTFALGWSSDGSSHFICLTGQITSISYATKAEVHFYTSASYFGEYELTCIVYKEGNFFVRVLTRKREYKNFPILREDIQLQ
jgi:hypothetical protein